MSNDLIKPEDFHKKIDDVFKKHFEKELDLSDENINGIIDLCIDDGIGWAIEAGKIIEALRIKLKISEEDNERRQKLLVALKVPGIVCPECKSGNKNSERVSVFQIENHCKDCGHTYYTNEAAKFKHRSEI